MYIALDSHTHGQLIEGKMHIWSVSRLWKLAEGLTAREIPVSCFDLDRDCWFEDVEAKPTVRAVVEHCKRMLNADLSYPVIIDENGEVMDGMHRIAKALLMKKKAVKTIQFSKTPPPDEILDKEEIEKLYRKAIR